MQTAPELHVCPVVQMTLSVYFLTASMHPSLLPIMLAHKKIEKKKEYKREVAASKEHALVSCVSLVLVEP
jgi:hypothetical protein